MLIHSPSTIYFLSHIQEFVKSTFLGIFLRISEIYFWMVLRQRVSYLMDLKRNSYFIELLIKLRESVYVKFYTNKLVIFTFIIKSKRSICFYVDPVEIGGVCSSTDPSLPLIWDQLATITPRSIFFKTITNYNLFYYNISIPQQQHRSFFSI